MQNSQAKWESKRVESAEQKQFKADMEKAGYEIRFYHGRNYYEGWAVDVDDRSQVQEVIRSTEVRVQTDQMGLGMIVYPMR